MAMAFLLGHTIATLRRAVKEIKSGWLTAWPAEAILAKAGPLQWAALSSPDPR
jgi:hypothetical protein